MVSIRLFEITLYRNTIVYNTRGGHVGLMNIHLRKIFYLCKATKEIFYLCKATKEIFYLCKATKEIFYLCKATKEIVLLILVHIILSSVHMGIAVVSQVITRHVLCRKLCTYRKKVQITNNPQKNCPRETVISVL
jgi:hypothetical protein